LSERIYGPYAHSALSGLQNHLISSIGGLKVEAKIIDLTSKGWVVVEVSGEDEEVAVRYLSQRFGRVPSSLDELSSGGIVKGSITESRRVGYGLYVDLGVQDADALIPLHTLRTQLGKGRVLSARKLADLYCLRDNHPLEVRITDVNRERGEVSAEISEGQMIRLQSWVDSMLERLLIFGVPEARIRNALHETHHRRDVVKIEYLGFLEHSAICKIGTQAPGLIAALGHLLRGVPMYAFNPEGIRNTIEAADERA